MSDDGAIYEGRRATGRHRHQSSFIRRIGSEISQQSDAVYRESSGGRTREMRQDYTEPELAHPGGEVENRVRSGMSSGIAKAATFRNVGKQVFLSVVKEAVDLVALEAASKALQEEMDEQKRAASRGMPGTSSSSRRSRGSGKTKPRSSPPRGVAGNDDVHPKLSSRPPIPSNDSAGGSTFEGFSPSRPSNARRSTNDANGPSGRVPSAAGGGGAVRGEGGSASSRGLKSDGSWIAGRGGGGQAEEKEDAAGSMTFRDTIHEMEDQERSMLLGLLSGAYNQVNELTDELQISLQKLNEAEVQVKELSVRPPAASQPSANGSAPLEPVAKAPEPGLNGNKQGVKQIVKDLLPSDEGANSTPATVRQLQAEVQRLRQRLAQSSAQEEKLRQRVQHANSKEEKQRADLARNQRLMAVMESQLNDGTGSSAPPTPRSLTPRGRSAASNAGSRSHTLQRSDSRASAGAFCVTPGGTRYQDGVTKPLVDRVTELEEKLVNSSMENATAKQDYLQMKLRSSQLEKSDRKLRHDLAKSEAMNDLLQNEIDRLQGISPEGEADGKGWRRWLGGLQEPLSPEPLKVASGDSDSPVVVVRDLDNNQLVYAPGRAEFM